MFVCVRDHAVFFCSRIEHSNACCNVYKEYDDDDICISFICIIYAIYYTKNKVFLSSIFEISHIVYYMYMFHWSRFSGLLGLAKISVKMLRVLPLRYKRVF